MAFCDDLQALYEMPSYYLVAYGFAYQSASYLGSLSVQKWIKWLRFAVSDEGFLKLVEVVETLMAKVLTLIMLVVILVSVWDVSRAVLELVTDDLINSNYKTYLKSTLFEIFGLFLTVLIALEIIENITGYLKKHEFQLELVIVTSLVAVARKIVIFDLESVDSSNDLIGLSATILTLTVSYWIVRQLNRHDRNKDKH